MKNGIKDENEASKVLSLMSKDKNLMTYAKVSEGIINKFKSNPSEFEIQFGYPLFEGEKINAERLYTDLFVNANSGKLLIRDSSGKQIVNTNTKFHARTNLRNDLIFNYFNLYLSADKLNNQNFKRSD